jgi:hypothetical protein
MDFRGSVGRRPGITVGSNEPYSRTADRSLRGRWSVDSYGTERLAAKDAESAIVARICEDFNLTPVPAKADYEQMARYFADYGQVPRARVSCATSRYRWMSRRASPYRSAASSRFAWS